MKELREQWMQMLSNACQGDYSRVLFLDETGAMTNLVRTYGRSAQGERCIGAAPAGHWKTMTAVAAIRLEGLTASATLPHAMDGELFLVYVEQALLPALNAGDVVVMDNLPGHRLTKVRQLIESTGARLLYLPPYSPDFNPIEMIWSKVKRLLRTAAARTVDALHTAFGSAMDAVTRADILGCFRHCGYATTFGAPLYCDDAINRTRRALSTRRWASWETTCVKNYSALAWKSVRPRTFSEAEGHAEHRAVNDGVPTKLAEAAIGFVVVADRLIPDEDRAFGVFAHPEAPRD